MSDELIDGRTIRKWGFHFAVGCLQGFSVLFILGFLLLLPFHDKDDCDKSFWEKCGVKVVTDNKTGRQYLVAPGGGIIERGK